MKFKRKALILFLTLAIGIVSACTTVDGVKLVSTTAENIAIKGYDPVAYFKENLAHEGKADFSLDWNGAKWYFSSAENRDEFAKKPEIYAPQFGGYCAYAVSKGYTADGDPNAWSIVNGKLYLNYNQEVKEKWEPEKEKRIPDGEKNWDGFKTKKPEHKG